MGIGIGNLNHIVLQLCAEVSIQNSKVNSDLAKAEGKRAEAQDQEKAAMRESAEGMRQVASGIQMASSAVSVGRSAASAGEAVHDYSQQQATQPQLRAGEQAAQTGSTDQLSHVRLGDNGPTVGERFSGNRMEMLAHPDRVNSAIVMGRDGRVDERASVQRVMEQSRGPNGEPGFTEGEARDLVRAAGPRGGEFNSDKAVDFMWGHRKTEAQTKSETQRQKIFDGIQSQITSGLARDAGLAAKDYSDRAKRFGQEVGKSEDLQGRFLDDMVAHNRKLGEIELTAIKGSRPTTSSAKR